MIDIHCHILPHVDDGSSSMDESLEMARMASLSGVTDIVATPHFAGEPEQIGKIREKLRLLEQRLRQEQIPVQLHPGAEILCLPGLPELAARHQLPTLGQGEYVLVEFYFDESYAYMDGMLTDIASAGYQIVIAHPERYAVIQRDPLLLRRWVRQGYLLQLNKGSVLGKFGPRAERAANDILAMGLAHLIASDAHGCHSRTPHMGALEQWVRECCDQRYAKILLEENPRRVLQGKGPVRG